MTEFNEESVGKEFKHKHTEEIKRCISFSKDPSVALIGNNVKEPGNRIGFTIGSPLSKEWEPSEEENESNMCKPQPVQLDCRKTECEYHQNAECTHPKPAITLNEQKGTFVCWTLSAQNNEEDDWNFRKKVIFDHLSMEGVKLLKGKIYEDLLLDPCKKSPISNKVDMEEYNKWLKQILDKRFGF